jgi:hypothetical protein
MVSTVVYREAWVRVECVCRLQSGANWKAECGLERFELKTFVARG